MNVLYIGSFDLPDNNAAAHRVINNSKCLNQLGCNVILIGMNYKKKYMFNKYEEFTHKDFKILQTGRPINILEWIVYSVDISKKVKTLIKSEEISLIFCYNLKSMLLKILIRIRKKLNVKLIGDITEWYHYSEINIIKRIIKNHDSDLRMKKLNFKMDALILISDFLNDYYKKVELKIQIPPLIDSKDSFWNISTYEFNNDKINIVFCGTLGNNKDDFSDFMKDISNNDNLHLHIIGETFEDFREKRDKNIEKFKNVTFYGKRNHVECISFLKGADYSILMRPKSLVNMAGFSTKLVESISCGTPIITNCIENYERYKSYLKTYNKNIKFEKKANNYIINETFDYRGYISKFQSLIKKRGERNGKFKK